MVLTKRIKRLTSI